MGLKNFHTKVAIILTISIIPIILGLIYIYYYGIKFVFFDQWEFVVIINKIINGNFEFSQLFKPVNEHVCFFPYAFMIILVFLTKFSNLAESCTILFLIAISLLVFYLYFKKTFNFKKIAFWFIPIPFLLFSFRHIQSLSFGFNINWFFPFTFSLLAFFSIFLQKESKKQIVNNINFGSAIIFATIASYSSSTGLLVWPSGFFQILISPIKRKRRILYIIIWSLVGLLEGIFYAFLVRKKIQFSSESLNITLLDYVKYFVALVGKSLFVNPLLAFWTGIIILAILIASMIMLKRNNRLKENSFLLTIIVFSFLTTILIIMGRGAFVAKQNYPYRYTTFTVLIVVALYIILVDLGVFARSKVVKISNIILITLMVISIPMAISEGFYEGQKRSNESKREEAFLLYTYKTQPVDILKRLYPPSGEMVEKYAPTLERLGYNVFSKEPMYPEFDNSLKLNNTEVLMGIDDIVIEPLLTMYEVGQVIYVTSNSEYSFLTIEGWALDPEAARAASGVYIEIGNKLYPAYYGLDRIDVADTYKNKAYRYSGFRRNLLLSDVESGLHDVTIKIISNDEKTYYEAKSFKLYIPASEKEENIDSSSFAKEDNSRYRINIDVYEEDMVISGDTILKGWVTDQKDIDYTDKVTILIYDGPKRKDNNYIGIADYYLFRPDVAKAFKVDEYMLSGFKFNLDTTKLENGCHTIYIYALNEDGVYSRQAYDYIVEN